MGDSKRQRTIAKVAGVVQWKEGSSAREEREERNRRNETHLAKAFSRSCFSRSTGGAVLFLNRSRNDPSLWRGGMLREADGTRWGRTEKLTLRKRSQV